MNSHCKNRQFFRNTYQKIEYLTENLHLLDKSQGNELPTSLCLGISLSFSMGGTIKQLRVKVGNYPRSKNIMAEEKNIMTGGGELVTNCDRFKNLKHSTVRPFAFTEQGVAMLASVLRSETAIRVSIRVMDAFVSMRHFLINNADVFRRLSTIEYHQLEMMQHQQESDKRIDEVFQRLDERSVQPKQGIFYDGQVYDAYTFVSDLVKSAKRSIVLIDNYVDETVLTLLDKRVSGVTADIYTQQINQQLHLDINRHNSQYPPINVSVFRRSHDRFLCIDDVVYHIGASIKDLGKKWFAFAKMEVLTPTELVAKINE